MPKRKAEESTIKKIRRMEKRLKKYKNKLRQPEDCKYYFDFTNFTIKVSLKHQFRFLNIIK